VAWHGLSAGQLTMSSSTAWITMVRDGTGQEDRLGHEVVVVFAQQRRAVA
jgi:hypothetical protein